MAIGIANSETPCRGHQVPSADKHSRRQRARASAAKVSAQHDLLEAIRNFDHGIGHEPQTAMLTGDWPISFPQEDADRLTRQTVTELRAAFGIIARSAHLVHSEIRCRRWHDRPLCGRRAQRRMVFSRLISFPPVTRLRLDTAER